MSDISESLVKIGIRINAEKANLKDRGRRRHLSWGMDFDTRSVLLAQEINTDWEKETKDQWQINRARVRQGLIRDFGEFEIEKKIENFLALGSKPFSILSYHNRFFSQVRHAFVVGAYYPALVGACALGERILNHLVIDLRAFYSSAPEFRKVARKHSFDNWDIPINALSSWNVFLPNVENEFHLLKALRNRSVHFNVATYSNVKEDSLQAILHLQKVIEIQFGSHGQQPWFCKGTLGHQFIAREWETNPFIQTYFLHNCPFLGPYFGMEHGQDGWQFFDFPEYGGDDLTDEEFSKAYNERTPEMMARKPEPHEPA